MLGYVEEQHCKLFFPSILYVTYIHPYTIFFLFHVFFEFFMDGEESNKETWGDVLSNSVSQESIR